MTTDQKIDELLRIVQANSALLIEHSSQLRDQHEQLQGHTEQFKVQGARIDDLFHLFFEERKLHNDHFSQLASGLKDVREEVRGVKVEMGKMDVRLNAKIDKVYESLSQDIQIFGGELHQVKRRVTHLEKKLLS